MNLLNCNSGGCSSADQATEQSAETTAAVNDECLTAAAQSSGSAGGIDFYPFAYALFDECLANHCWYCLDEEKKLKRCTGCQRALFCEKRCQSLGWKDHKFECRALKANGGRLPDIEVRLLGRIVTRQKAILCGLDKRDPDFYKERSSRRNILDIWAHTKQIEQDKFAMNKFEDIYVRLTRFYEPKALLNKQTIFELHCRDFINRHAISDRHYLREIGKGLYLDLCAYDHSCRPNTVYSCRSFVATLRPLNSQVNLLDRSTTFYSYIDLLCAKQDRRKLLKDTWYFNCECERCLDESEHLLTAMLCPNCAPTKSTRLCVFGQPEYKDPESQLISCPECGKTLSKAQVLEAVSAMRFVGDVFDKTELEKMGRTEAVKFVEELLQKFSQLLPPVNVYLCKIVQALLPLIDQDDTKRLLELHLLAEECLRVCYPKNHPALAFHLRNIGIFAKCLGLRQLAIRYLREAEAMFRFVMGADHSLTSLTREILTEVEGVQEEKNGVNGDRIQKKKEKMKKNEEDHRNKEEERANEASDARTNPKKKAKEQKKVKKESVGEEKENSEHKNEETETTQKDEVEEEGKAEAKKRRRNKKKSVEIDKEKNEEKIEDEKKDSNKKPENEKKQDELEERIEESTQKGGRKKKRKGKGKAVEEKPGGKKEEELKEKQDDEKAKDENADEIKEITASKDEGAKDGNKDEKAAKEGKRRKEAEDEKPMHPTLIVEEDPRMNEEDKAPVDREDDLLAIPEVKVEVKEESPPNANDEEEQLPAKPDIISNRLPPLLLDVPAFVCIGTEEGPAVELEMKEENDDDQPMMEVLCLQVGSSSSRPGSALSLGSAVSGASSLSPSSALDGGSSGGGGGHHSPGGGVKKRLQQKKTSPRARTPMYPKMMKTATTAAAAAPETDDGEEEKAKREEEAEPTSKEADEIEGRIQDEKVTTNDENDDDVKNEERKEEKEEEKHGMNGAEMAGIHEEIDDSKKEVEVMKMRMEGEGRKEDDKNEEESIVEFGCKAEMELEEANKELDDAGEEEEEAVVAAQKMLLAMTEEVVRNDEMKRRDDNEDNDGWQEPKQRRHRKTKG